MKMIVLYIVVLMSTGLALHAVQFSGIEFDEIEKRIDGYYKGESVEVVFRYKNLSEEPLIITGVTASCPCLGIKSYKDVLSSGESDEIVAVVSTEAFDGIVNLFVECSFSDKEIVLVVRGVEGDDMSVEPKNIYVDMPSGIKNKITSFSLNSKYGNLRSFEGVNSSAATIVVEPKKGSSEFKIDYDVVVSSAVLQPDKNMVEERITLKFEDGVEGDIVLPIIISRNQMVVAEPKGVRFGVVGVGGEYLRRLMIKGSGIGLGGIRVKGFDLESERFSASIEEENDNYITFSIVFDGRRDFGKYFDKLSIATNYGNLIVPITAIIKKDIVIEAHESDKGFHSHSNGDLPHRH